jgi:hypothetical protein
MCLLQFLLLLISLNFCSSRKLAVEKGVIKLDDDNFYSTVDHFDLLLVAFYDPDSDWENLEGKQFEKAAKHLRKNKQKPMMRLAKVDWWENLKLAESFKGKNTWPVYKFFQSGLDYDFRGTPNALGFTSFMENEQYVMTSKLQEMVKEIEDGKSQTDSFAAQAKDGDVALLGTFRELNSQIAIAFKKLPWRDNMAHIAFGITDDPMAAIRFKIGHCMSGNGGMVLFRSWDKPVNYPKPLYAGDFAPVLKWLRHESRRSIHDGVLTMDDALKLAGNSQTTLHMYTFARDPTDKLLRASISLAYLRTEGKVLHVLCDAFAAESTGVRQGLRVSFEGQQQSVDEQSSSIQAEGGEKGGAPGSNVTNVVTNVIGVVLVKWMRSGGSYRPRLYEMPLHKGSRYQEAMSMVKPTAEKDSEKDSAEVGSVTEGSVTVEGTPLQDSSIAQAAAEGVPGGGEAAGRDFPLPLYGVANGLDLFARDFLAAGAMGDGTIPNSLRRNIISAPAVDDSHSPLKIVVGDEFHTRVTQSKMDVFLLFHATSMLDRGGQYSNFEQQFRRLAVSFKSAPSVMIAKMDVEANELDHPRLTVGTAKPSVILLKASDPLKPIVYEYGKQIDAAQMVEFLDSHGIKMGGGHSANADEVGGDEL